VLPSSAVLMDLNIVQMRISFRHIDPNDAYTESWSTIEDDVSSEAMDCFAVEVRN
jgi:hypothetical protein